MHKSAMHNIIMNDNGNKLNSEWNLYFHDPNSYNWGKDSYCKIYTLKDIIDYWILNTEIEGKIHQGMFFLMRENIFPTWEDPENRLGIVSFLVEGSHPHDVALLLDNRGISIRAGHHCAQPAMRHFKVDTTLRVSFGIYNNEEDIDNFIFNLKDIIKYF